MSLGQAHTPRPLPALPGASALGSMSRPLPVLGTPSKKARAPGAAEPLSMPGLGTPSKKARVSQEAWTPPKTSPYLPALSSTTRPLPGPRTEIPQSSIPSAAIGAIKKRWEVGFASVVLDTFGGQWRHKGLEVRSFIAKVILWWLAGAAKVTRPCNPQVYWCGGCLWCH